MVNGQRANVCPSRRRVRPRPRFIIWGRVCIFIKFRSAINALKCLISSNSTPVVCSLQTERRAVRLGGACLSIVLSNLIDHQSWTQSERESTRSAMTSRHDGRCQVGLWQTVSWLSSFWWRVGPSPIRSCWRRGGPWRDGVATAAEILRQIPDN